MPTSCAKEAFGPVAVLSTFRDFDAALDEVNDSVFGLQAGVFTRDLYRAQRAWDALEVGGVMVGDVPSWRVDHMPYGGVKESGLGPRGRAVRDGGNDGDPSIRPADTARAIRPRFARVALFQRRSLE